MLPAVQTKTFNRLVCILVENIGAESQSRIENNIEMLMSLLEPVMILVMGGLVGLIVAAMILPIFELSSGMGG